MARKTEAETSLEVILTLSGEVCSADPDVGIMGPYVDDAGVDSVTVDVAGFVTEGGKRVRRTATMDILAGLDGSKLHLTMTPEWWVMSDTETGREVARRKAVNGNLPFLVGTAARWGLDVAKGLVLGNFAQALGHNTACDLLLEGVDDEPHWEEERDEP